MSHCLPFDAHESLRVFQEHIVVGDHIGKVGPEVAAEEGVGSDILQAELCAQVLGLGVQPGLTDAIKRELGVLCKKQIDKVDKNRESLLL